MKYNECDVCKRQWEGSLPIRHLIEAEPLLYAPIILDVSRTINEDNDEIMDVCMPCATRLKKVIAVEVAKIRGENKK